MYWLILAYSLSGISDPIAYGPYKSLAACEADIAYAEERKDEERRELKAKGFDVTAYKWFAPLCLAEREGRNQYVLIALNETKSTQEVILTQMKMLDCLGMKDSSLIRYSVAQRAIRTGERLVLDCVWLNAGETYRVGMERWLALTPAERKEKTKKLLADIDTILERTAIQQADMCIKFRHRDGFEFMRDHCSKYADAIAKKEAEIASKRAKAEAERREYDRMMEEYDRKHGHKR